jgi:HPt (histidine-containing phosphotransfer) domain-containing protein
VRRDAHHRLAADDDGQGCALAGMAATAEAANRYEGQPKVGAMETGSEISLAAVRRAEEALEELSEEFDDWMSEEVAHLVETHGEVAAGGYLGEAAEQFFRIAHDLKGEALTFGYPLVTRICASLCLLLETVENNGASPPLHLFHAHVKAIHVLHREKIKGDTNEIAIAMFDTLSAATDRFVASNPPPSGDGT